MKNFHRRQMVQTKQHLTQTVQCKWSVFSVWRWIFGAWGTPWKGPLVADDYKIRSLWLRLQFGINENEFDLWRQMEIDALKNWTEIIYKEKTIVNRYYSRKGETERTKEGKEGRNRNKGMKKGGMKKVKVSPYGDECINGVMQYQNISRTEWKQTF